MLQDDVKFQEEKQTESGVSKESSIDLQYEQDNVDKRNTIEVELSSRQNSSNIQTTIDGSSHIPIENELNAESTETSDRSEILNENITSKRCAGRPRIEREHVGRPRKIYNMVEVRETENSDSESQEEYGDCDDFAGAIETSLKEALASDKKGQMGGRILIRNKKFSEE